MPLAGIIRRPSRRDPAVRRIARAWRELTGGTDRPDTERGRTLIACSGGGDSSGLVLALAAAGPAGSIVVGHVVHDMRPGAEAHADRDAAAELACALGLAFVQRSIRVRGAGANAEATARRLRYAALAEMAREAGCGFIATAHHAEDQLETVLMGLLRGAGPRGLAGVAPSRKLRGATLIRPALGVGREDLQRVCAEAGWTWREDSTNADRSRLRAAIRHGVTPELERLRPGAARRAARSAALLGDAAALVDEEVATLLSAGRGTAPSLGWAREMLRGLRPLVLGALLKAAAAEVGDGKGRDRLGSEAVGAAVRAIRGREVRPREIAWRGVAVSITSKRVEIRRGGHG